VEAGAERQPWHQDESPLVLAGEPRLAYQPVVDMGSGQLLGFEALIRWHHPTEGVIIPSLLIPWAEANGDIVPLGDWVLKEGCHEATRWPANVQLAVNCSIVQLRRGVASRAVLAALEDSGLMPDRLTVECTERVMSDEEAIADLRLIGALGVQLAVDDVGTSWNSFEILRRLAVNTVKIDGSFVRGLEPHEGINRMVVETVVHVAHNCGMSTVAEGVETALHASIVRQFDSDAAQGYYFAPPLSQENATKLANIPNLRFPLDGLGWDDNDDWPFAGVSEGNGRLGPSVRASRAALASATATDAVIEMDGIDLVDLVLDGAGGEAGPSGGAVERAAGPAGNGNGSSPHSGPDRSPPPARREATTEGAADQSVRATRSRASATRASGKTRSGSQAGPGAKGKGKGKGRAAGSSPRAEAKAHRTEPGTRPEDTTGT